MTLEAIDALQTRMLKHPDNRFNSSALGRYQIVRTTLRAIRKTIKLSPSALFDVDMQDRCVCYLLGFPGIDKYRLIPHQRLRSIINRISRDVL